MATRRWSGTRRKLAVAAAAVLGTVLLELLAFNRYYVSYRLFHLQPQTLAIQSGILHDFEWKNGKLVALNDHPSITFENIDTRVERLAFSCKNAKPGAEGQVYFLGPNEALTQAPSIGYSTASTLYNRVLDLPIGRNVTAIQLDLTNIEGDHVVCADILVNPAASLSLARSRLALYTLVFLGVLAGMWRQPLRDAAAQIPGRMKNIAAALVPADISTAEAALIVLLALGAAGTAFWRASILDPTLYKVGSGAGFGPGYRLTDMWFNADISKIVAMSSDAGTFQDFVTSEHPLITLAMYPPVSLLRSAGLTAIGAIRVYWALLAALWTAILFIVLRTIGCRTRDAALFTLMSMTTAAFVFWFSVPEAFSLGSVSILLAIYLVTVVQRTRPSILAHALINLLTLSITLTNWMVGGLEALLNLPWRRAVLAVAGGFLLALPLWGVEKLAFPDTSFFLGSTGRLSQYMHIPPPVSRIFEVIPSFFIDTVVMPQIQAYNRAPYWRVMTTTGAIAGSGSPIGYVGAAAWLVLLALGAYACFALWRETPVIQLVVLITAGQLGLNFVFGTEPFLYSMHFLPLLVLIAATATRLRWRPIATRLATAVALICIVNNTWQFMIAAEFIRSMGRIAARF